jgi:hypothetical protein
MAVKIANAAILPSAALNSLVAADHRKRFGALAREPSGGQLLDYGIPAI